jgi:DUF2934 family protein
MSMQPVKPAEEKVLPKAPSTEERIRIRAYELFEARKGAPSDPVADWYQAEAEIKEKQPV